MSSLAPILLILAVQITVPLCGGLLLSRRRDPAAPQVSSLAFDQSKEQAGGAGLLRPRRGARASACAAQPAPL